VLPRPALFPGEQARGVGRPGLADLEAVYFVRIINGLIDERGRGRCCRNVRRITLRRAPARPTLAAINASSTRAAPPRLHHWGGVECWRRHNFQP
jgi:hypothetical protein